MPPPAQQQLQQQPQDVLAEARKNLQVLIDSGMSRDLLHQLVDGSPTLQFNFPVQSSLPQLPSQSHQGQVQPPPPPPPSLAPPPPPPQCPPPPIPTAQQQQQQSSSPQAAQSPQHVLSPSATPTPTLPSSHAAPEVKPDMQLPSDVPRTCSTTYNNTAATSPSFAPTPNDGSHFAAMMAFPGAAAPFAHRPRISVSSTSSGSSGHASVFSNLSSHSAMSWASTGSNCTPRMQAPLPMPPSINPGTGTPLMNGGQVGASGSTSKHNIYWCTSCETSFKRKYDWKRHEDEFHERWRKYPCPEPGCNRSFWGSNSFNQHHKQCHGCTTCPHAEKVVKFLRKRKYWACGFCSALHPARERHVEHVARHFESGMTKGEWMHSRVVYGLLHQPLIHEAWDALITSKHSEYGPRRPRFSWHPTKTGRAQGFLEKENPGQLQDLLEFFSGDEGEAQWIASVAYDLADIVMDNSGQLTPTPFPTHNPMAAPPSYQDPRMSFASMPPPPPPQQQQQPMLASEPNAHNPYAAATFQPPPMLMASQPFAGPSPPSSASHSPLTSNHSPITPSHASIIKQESQQPQSLAHAGDGGDSSNIMDFEYSPVPPVFDEWDSIHNQGMDDHTQTQAQHAPSAAPSHSQSDWGNMMMGYFGDSQIRSS
ncbi:ZnF C2H2 [Geosmithia morbida]|uniref:ZnF C2H2 n=1 Tax=Geosmithia morbida TaxID=1094350 RepID=A0A9P4YP07_9HYPO|nr:ZnF C2H2 [Geosmithia morbida]KAF4119952.1 ZnF C2H2 [Geosmithia morbida]